MVWIIESGINRACSNRDVDIAFFIKADILEWVTYTKIHINTIEFCLRYNPSFFNWL